SFRAMAEFNSGTASMMVGDLALRARLADVSRGFFDVFATDPARGRRFAAEESREGGSHAAIVSDRFWRDHFGGLTNLSAARLRVDGEPYAIVGVMPPAFAFPADVDVWTPREARSRNPFRTGHNWQVVARLRDDVSIAAARAEATTV